MRAPFRGSLGAVTIGLDDEKQDVRAYAGRDGDDPYRSMQIDGKERDGDGRGQYIHIPGCSLPGPYENLPVPATEDEGGVRVGLCKAA